MNIIYLINVIVLVKLFQYFYKFNSVNTKELIKNCNSSKHCLDNNSSKEISKELGKNKWLHPDDEFVKYKKIKYYKSKNYEIK